MEENAPIDKTPDFVLVWENSPFCAKEEFQIMRKKFEESLIKNGLELFYVPKPDGANLNAIEIHAPQKVLERNSELLKIRMPIHKIKENGFHEHGRRSNTLITTSSEEDPLLLNVSNLNGAKPKRPGIWNSIRKRVGNFKEKHIYPDKLAFPDYKKRYTTIYSRSYKSLFDSSDCFTPAVRLRIIQFILDWSEFAEKDINCSSCEINFFGIQNLLTKGVYSAAFPIHDKGEEHKRHRLIKEWASLKQWYRFQPLDYIRDYFGAKIGLYFAWLGFYTRMLIPAAVFGLLCVLYGCFTLPFDQPSRDICEGHINVKMCPICDQFCDYWNLSDTCFYSKITHFLDNTSAILFAIFISLWAVTFLKQWKRYSAEISHRWDLLGHDVEEEQVRPQYLAQYECMEKKGQVTRKGNVTEISFWSRRLPVTVLSFSLSILLVALSLATVLGVALYRVSVRAALTAYGDSEISSNAIIITSFSTAVINLVCMEALNKIYPRLTKYMTEQEMHRTPKGFEDSFVMKMYLFNFVNYYASIFYIAFFKGNFVGYPGRYVRFFGFRNEECGPEGCLVELSIQLAVIMIGKQAFNTFLEMILPLTTKWQKEKTTKKVETSESAVPQWKKEYQLNSWNSQILFLEYLEIIMQYGFVTLFAAAFPLAPLFALINNILETRLDAKKFLLFYQRPVAQQVRDIGVWFDILDSISKLAVMTNGFIIAFTSDFIPKLVYMMVAKGSPSLSGYLNSSLSIMDTDDLDLEHLPQSSTQYCRYTDYREPPWSDHKYMRTTHYWHVLVARLVFVLIFENVVMLIVLFYNWCIPDVPGWVQEQIKEESKAVKELIDLELKNIGAREHHRDVNESSGEQVEDQSQRILQHQAVVHANYGTIFEVESEPRLNLA